MALSKTIATVTALAALGSAQGDGSSAAHPILTPEIVETLGNNSLFNRWRPRSHFLSPHSWMNDPCGPMYDPNTKLYHLQYQYHPNHVDWGNISWGHATSRDLFHWEDVGGWDDDEAVSFAPGSPSAPIAVFTGTTQPVNLQGEQDGSLLTFLTGIHYLPTNWKIPYEEGTEVQALYLSHDGGTNWEEVGTVLPAPPEGWNVTGWRDPSFFPSELLDDLTGASEPRYYMVLGSGLKGDSIPATLPGAERPGFLGPRIPFYAAPASNLTDWTFLGALFEPAGNESLGEPDVTGSWGYNFEVSSFFALDVPTTGEKAWFVGAGAEGGNTTSHWREQWALWNRGDVSARDNGSVAFEPNSGGALDWGIAYAQATWEDPAGPNGPRRVVWGWANEDIVGDAIFDTAKQLGYQGVMNLPAELYIKETHSVLNCHADKKDGNLCVADESDNRTSTAQTLGIRPLPEVLELMRNGSECLHLKGGRVGGSSARKIASDLGDSYELMVTLKKWRGRTGIIVGQSPDNEEYTVIYFDPDASIIGVDRERSSLLPQFRNLTFEGHFEPYILQESGRWSHRGKRNEEIEFHLVVDGSLLQVWVNERFALTARIYPSRKDSTGLSLFAGDFEGEEGDEIDDECESKGGAIWSKVTVWKGLAKAWPERPENSSADLVWDSAEQTGNYTRWSGF